tara:strand:+ start:276 stop:698 length:423 start_codon:yes stop_codon:yes gene_type:complete
MVKKLKYQILITFVMIIGHLQAFTLDQLNGNSSNISNDLFNLNKLEHNFSVTMGMQSNNTGSMSYYSIGDQMSYNISDKLTFTGGFNLITSSLGFNQFEYGASDVPKLDYNLGLKYNISDNANFEIRIIKNSSQFSNNNF